VPVGRQSGQRNLTKPAHALTEAAGQMAQQPGQAKSEIRNPKSEIGIGQRPPPASIDGPEELPQPKPGFEEMVEPVPQTQPRIELTEPAGEPVLDMPLESYYADDAIDFQPPKLKAHRDGFFQKLSLTGTWLIRGLRRPTSVLPTLKRSACSRCRFRSSSGRW
jgi:hypothetical protein